jgi:hypothetical protein
MTGPIQTRTKKKLLVAAVGVASVSYVGCSSNMTTTANLMVPSQDASSDAEGDAFISSGNLVIVAPDSPPDAPADATDDMFVTTANLAPPPSDAGRE